MLGSGWNVRDLTTLAEAPNVEETGVTFAENAALKAIAISRLFTGLVLADDSGLEVDALNGDPGVRSARFAGESATDAHNRLKLIGILNALPTREFPARFRCEMVLASQGEALGSFSGTV
jgi:XTP/dITP diphosphohydrolase